ncbi:MAG: glycosyltransferase family 4 protein [Nitrospiraceae bacterium]
MKVVLLADVSSASVIGGAERVLREHAVGLGRRGHEAAIVARMPPDDQRPTVVQGGIAEHRFPVSRRHALAFVWSSIRQSVRTFDQACRSVPADAVVMYQALAGIGPILRRRPCARQWIYVCLSLAHEEYLSRASRTETWLNRLQLAVNERVRLWIEWLVLRRCDQVIVLSEFMRERVKAVHHVPEDRIRLIPGAADLTTFRPAGDRAAVRQSLKLPPAKTLLLTVRNLVPRMGLEHLIAAMQELGEEGRDCLLLIGGEGTLRSALERQIREQGLADRVALLGFILEADLPKYYQAADLVLMPTYELEGFGLVTVEALACGTPVLGTPVGAIPEVLVRLDPELVSEGTDGRSLAAALRRILRRFRERPDERARLAAAGLTLVEQDYNWEKHVARLERALSG